MDRDGLCVWLEYAFATDPFELSSPLSAALDENDPTKLLLRYPRRSEAATRGLQYVVEVSPDLQQWFDESDDLADAFGAGFAIGERAVSALPGAVEQWEGCLPLGFGEVFFRIRVLGP